MNVKRKTMPIRVDFNDPLPEDEIIRAEGFLGLMTTNYISEKSGRTPSQVTYRLGVLREKYGMPNRIDARNGKSEIANLMMAAAQPVMQRELEKYLKKHL